MIYLTALWVVSPKTEEEGVNALMYEVDGPLVHRAGGGIDLRASIPASLGSPTRALTSIKPGGNRVRTYLDVVMTEGSELVLDAALTDIRRRLGDQAPPISISSETFAAEFNTELGLSGAAPAAITELGTQLVALLRSDARVWTAARSPLVVEVASNDEEVSFALSPQSAARVRAARDASWRAPRIRFEHAVFADLEAMLPDTWGEIAMMLTGLSTERLLGLGGIRYDLVGTDASRRTLVEWPERMTS